MSDPNSANDAQESAKPLADPTVGELLRHPEVRNYQVAALAALVVLFGMLMGRGIMLGGALTAIIGVAGIFLRWIAAPVFVIILTTYFALFPSGVPEFGYSDPFMMSRQHFRLEDMILTAAVLVYVASQYRLFGVLTQSVPSEDRRSNLKRAAIRRPPSAIPAREIVPMFLAIGMVVVVGQAAWWCLSTVRIVAGDGFSLVIPNVFAYRQSPQAGRFSPAGSRFVLLAGMVFFPAVLAMVVFAYRRYRALPPLEAKQILQDTQWRENYREFSRIETWRTWAQRRQNRRK